MMGTFLKLPCPFLISPKLKPPFPQRINLHILPLDGYGRIVSWEPGEARFIGLREWVVEACGCWFFEWVCGG